MDPATIAVVASIILRVVESVQAGKKPELSDAELDLLRSFSQSKLDAFLKTTGPVQ